LDHNPAPLAEPDSRQRKPSVASRDLAPPRPRPRGRLAYDLSVDAISDYRAASEANDIDALVETLAMDVELISPLSGRMVFRGRDDVRVLLSAIYGTLKDLRWDEELGDGNTRFLVGKMRVGPFRLDDAMVFELAADGHIKRIRPHLRPWLAMTFFALLLGPKIGRNPGVMLRALRG
jgi:SnoaL-like domain